MDNQEVLSYPVVNLSQLFPLDESICTEKTPKVFFHYLANQVMEYIKHYAPDLDLENFFHSVIIYKNFSLVKTLSLGFNQSNNQVRRNIDQGAVEIDGEKIPPKTYELGIVHQILIPDMKKFKDEGRLNFRTINSFGRNL